MTKNNEKLPLVNCALDLGNGEVKIAIEVGKKVLYSTIPALFSDHDGDFTITFSNKTFYYGEGCRPTGYGRRTNNGKYYAPYINQLFRAVIVNWMLTHNKKPSFFNNKRLNITTTMPPELYYNQEARKQAETAYKAVFGYNFPMTIKSSEFKDFTAFTQYSTVKPEALLVAQMLEHDARYTLLFDVGHGTLDIILLDGDKVRGNRSVQRGITAGIDQIMNENPHLTWHNEGELLAQQNPDLLNRYFAQVQSYISKVYHQVIKRGNVYVHGIGGGLELMSEQTKNSFGQEYEYLTFGDGYSTVEAVMKDKQGQS